MRAAAAFEAGEPGTDLGIARMRIVGEERGRRHDPAIDAVAALRHLLVDPGLLELMRLLRRAEPGERRDLAAGRRRDRGDAGADGAAVEMDGAGAALREAAAEALWLRPLGLLRGAVAQAMIASGDALPLAGGPLAFTLIEALALRDGSLLAAATTLARLQRWAVGQEAAVAERVTAQLVLLAAGRKPWAGLAFDRPLVMGVVNVTPDSFSDGGDFTDPARAIAARRAMLAAR